MNSITPTDRDDTFPIDRYPDPIIDYTVDDGVPEVEAVNEAFESAFGPISPGSPVRTIVERAGISTPDASRDFLDHLEGADVRLVNVETAANGYRARVLPPTDGIDGYVFLIDEGSIDRDASRASSGAGRPPHEGNTARSEPKRGGSDWDDEFDIDRVASVLSHDLRNPLDVAKARLRAARETGADEHFDHVEKAHERMERIIEDVLTLSRGAEYIEPDDAIELRTVLESAWETVETGSATLTIADGLPMMVADGDRLERLLENLFRNAVEHGDQPAVTVGALDGTTTGFYVADDGPGIPPEDHSVIFEPGYSSRDHGTGLGLSIVKRIAEAHGWTIDVRNEGSGVRFEIRGMDPAS
jgi:signal transduction histidine kinase